MILSLNIFSPRPETESHSQNNYALRWSLIRKATKTYNETKINTQVFGNGFGQSVC